MECSDSYSEEEEEEESIIKRWIIQGIDSLKNQDIKSKMYHANGSDITYYFYLENYSDDNTPIKFHIVFPTIEYALKLLIEVKIANKNSAIKGKQIVCIEKANDDSSFCLNNTWKYLLDPENKFMINNNLFVEVKLSEYVEKQSVQFKTPSDSTTKQVYSSVSKSSCAIYSKDETGYVGLQNQGATCYMNSMLQALYHIPEFRRLIYQMDVNSIEGANKDIPINLQRLFCQLQFSDTAPNTKALTKSFGWNSLATFIQHDVQEFARILIDKIELKLNKTPLQGKIAEMFRGEFTSFVRCPDCGYESSTTESFYDISLEVKDTKDLKISLKKYTEKELLTDENQYNIEGKGRFNAEKGIEFTKFPPILNFHLNRSEYDPEKEQIVKIDSRFEFPESIDLNEFLAENSDQKNSSQIYSLFGVLVHSGTVNYGHYCAFLRTSSNDPQWYEFNDTCVQKVSKEKAVDDNYGGASNFSGYYLIYVRNSDAERIFKPVTDDEVPEALREWYRNKTEHRSPKKAGDENLFLYTEDSIKWTTRLGMPSFVCSDKKRSIRIEGGKITGKELYDKCAHEFQWNRDEIKVWRLYYNNVPSSVVDDDNTQISLFYKNFFVTKSDKNSEVQKNFNDYIYVYCCFFFTDAEMPLQYIGNFIIQKTSTIKDLASLVNERIGYPADTPLECYELMTNEPLKIEITDDSGELRTFENYCVSSGSIYIFEVAKHHIRPNTTTFEILPPLSEEDKHILHSSSRSYLNQSQSSSFSSKYELYEDNRTEELSKIQKIQKIPKIPKPEKQVPVFFYDEEDSSDDIDEQCNKKKSISAFFEQDKKLLKCQIYSYKARDERLATIVIHSTLSIEELTLFLSKCLNFDYNPEEDAICIYRITHNGMSLMYEGTISYYLQEHLGINGYFTLFVDFEKRITFDELSKRTLINVTFRNEDNQIKSSLIRMNLKSSTAEIVNDALTEFNEEITESMSVFNVVDHRIVGLADCESIFDSYLCQDLIITSYDDSSLSCFFCFTVICGCWQRFVGIPGSVVLNESDTSKSLKKRLNVDDDWNLVISQNSNFLVRNNEFVGLSLSYKNGLVRDDENVLQKWRERDDGTDTIFFVRFEQKS
ncbi:Clan CA, family C19, ubiquitin hydrolase-like cysteine peptidase [Trichomonas vaginalis G3]|uniref:Clan CA, family C19, ubiquitin hydrolase-like cysteine peptidase n=1 Tax=Trichomonas vaginalis (strain ATCC PRA-98 / G3) TaxID=412133 RepID=A2FU72_TRIV3|nr:ubiquitinyl hydrolase protein [Trichomonas vaginalis G3]EAX91552.1 Clan CA, family C19, ubiquitin hydrolase-like cysteine peptidase [Trichomonas vaginalis G3]KAI5511679.1 ubiquitinyl hydrolase protein [Trichomonas vaginalis G3]|eukprot:XP_001304482.1 Clan CA, family C19, ubiquitin hydrolase-like cysteine peptidase [Trichomonas vaginalis G3]